MQNLENTVRHILKVTGSVFAVFLVMLVFVVVFRYNKKVYAYKSIVASKLANVDVAHKQLPKTISQMMALEYSCSNVTYVKCDANENKNYAVATLVANPMHAKHLKRHAILLMLSYVIIDNLSDAEKNSLIADLFYMGVPNKVGFANASEFYFKKPLTKLTEQESAKLVALIKAPSIYQKDPIAWQNRADWILKNQ